MRPRWSGGRRRTGARHSSCRRTSRASPMRPCVAECVLLPSRSFPSLQITFGCRRQHARGSIESSDISRSSRSPSARRCQRPRSVEKRQQADGLTDGEATTAWQLGSAVDGSATNVSEWCGILTSCLKTRSRSRGVDMMMTRLTSFKSAPAGKVPCPFTLVLGVTASTVIFAVICCSASRRAWQHGGSRRSRMSDVDQPRSPACPGAAGSRTCHHPATATAPAVATTRILFQRTLSVVSTSPSSSIDPKRVWTVTLSGYGTATLLIGGPLHF